MSRLERLRLLPNLRLPFSKGGDTFFRFGGRRLCLFVREVQSLASFPEFLVDLLKGRLSLSDLRGKTLELLRSALLADRDRRRLDFPMEQGILPRFETRGGDARFGRLGMEVRLPSIQLRTMPVQPLPGRFDRLGLPLQFLRLGLEIRTLLLQGVRFLLELALALQGACFEGLGFVVYALFETDEFALPFPECLLRGLRLRVEPAEFRLPTGQLLVPLMEQLRLGVQLCRGLRVSLLPPLQVLFLLAEDRFSGRQFTRFRGSALSGLQVLREGFGPVDFCVQLRLETGRFRLRLELAPLSRFVRRLGGRLEGLDLFGQCRQLPFTGLNRLSGIIEVACVGFVLRGGQFGELLLRLREFRLSFLDAPFPFLDRLQVAFRFQDSLGRRPGNLPRLGLTRPNLRFRCR